MARQRSLMPRAQTDAIRRNLLVKKVLWKPDAFQRSGLHEDGTLTVHTHPVPMRSRSPRFAGPYIIEFRIERQRNTRDAPWKYSLSAPLVFVDVRGESRIPLEQRGGIHYIVFDRYASSTRSMRRTSYCLGSASAYVYRAQSHGDFDQMVSLLMDFLLVGGNSRLFNEWQHPEDSGTEWRTEVMESYRKAKRKAA